MTEANRLSSGLIFEERLREGDRGQVAQTSLFALPVVYLMIASRASWRVAKRSRCTRSVLGEPQKLSIGAWS